MNPYSVLKKPILSEKSTMQRDQDGKYTFNIDLRASKIDVKKAVEKVFDVSVVKVTTLINRGKMKRKGMHVSLQKRDKKAIVTLAKDQKIKLFEDQ